MTSPLFGICLTLAAAFAIAAAAGGTRLVWRVLRLTLVLTACGLVLLPFMWLLAAAFKDRSIFNDFVFWPPLDQWSTESINLDNYRRLFEGKSSIQGTVFFWRYVLNSAMLASVITLGQLLFASMAGYALAKFQFRGRKALILFLLLSMMIPGVLLLAPVYKLAVDLGLVDSLWGLVLPNLVSAYGVFLFRQAMLSVPNAIIDAGRVDGCSEFRIYYELVMPLVRPMTAAFCLITFLGQWNAFFMPNVFLHSSDNLTLPIVLNLYVTQYDNDYGVFLAGTLLAILPPAVMFLALQKEFIGGLTSGAVKG